MVQDIVCGATNTHPTHVAKFHETFPAPGPHFLGKIHRLHLQVKEKHSVWSMMIFIMEIVTSTENVVTNSSSAINVWMVTNTVYLVCQLFL